MKKILTLLLAVAMIFSFVACDQAAGGKAPVNPENVDPSTLTEKIESADVNDLRDVMSKATDCCSDMMTDITPLFGPPLPDPLVPITDKISGEIVRPLWDDVFDKVRPIKPPE